MIRNKKKTGGKNLLINLPQLIRKSMEMMYLIVVEMEKQKKKIINKFRTIIGF